MIKLKEIGPRLKLKLHKIEMGFLKGNVLYHSIVKKEDDEKLAQTKSIKKKQFVKDLAKRKQEKTVRSKSQALKKKVKTWYLL